MTRAKCCSAARRRHPANAPRLPARDRRLICSLASAQASYVPGASWRADGGFEVVTPLASGQYREKYLPKV